MIALKIMTPPTCFLLVKKIVSFPNLYSFTIEEDEEANTKDKLLTTLFIAKNQKIKVY